MNDGSEPDYRFTLANERTFLAWVRTALALLAGALVIHQVIHFEPRWALVTITGTLAVLAAILSVGAYRHWHANQRAMRHASPLPRTSLIPLLATATVVLSMLAVLIIAMHR
ncbi:YidH family protein [Piscinibacter sp.]|uniref:YidH family protein n=1 Tax=Piscinibacter sp. TaxID=1903157 RepID=UPI002C88BC35|nr:DUF202 domain-containing protein [Albitalea sp.]HUG26291.1 DUF202 domain-containing protein [Albitalea sp.]